MGGDGEREEGGPEIIAHTADLNYDVLRPNERFCPRLNTLRRRAEHSDENTSTFSTSDEAALLRRMMA